MFFTTEHVRCFALVELSHHNDLNYAFKRMAMKILNLILSVLNAN